ncbi:ATP-binding protein [Candidatus Woesearchaeota archaeon]|nr:MAG: ATP-binding protein [Candidatus Woesearchaeota archaeon]
MTGKKNNTQTKGIIIGGKFGEILARQKSTTTLEIGELLIAETPEQRILFQVYDLLFGSQLSQQNLELISGMNLEEHQASMEFLEPHERTYTLAFIKALATLKGRTIRTAKTLPAFFSHLRDVQEEDLVFTTPPNPLFVGNLRSGSKQLDIPINLPGRETLTHHILIPATTGRGKSNLMKVILWNLASENYAGVLVLDPHDEYYRGSHALSNHPNKNKIAHYSPNPSPGQPTLTIHTSLIRPEHFDGALSWSTAQKECITAYYKKFKEHWIEAIIKAEELDQQVVFREETAAVVRRRLINTLGITYKNNTPTTSASPFSFHSGTTTIRDVLSRIEEGSIVVIDTSSFSGAQEILIGSMFASALFASYKRHKARGALEEKPVAVIVLEEAPRVLGKEVLEQGPNIFSTIAREGRKFNLGIVAITQLPSLIPRQILANMNTKIILGTEMKPERQAIIESAAQDLSKDDRAIASLDKGEAIITSNFTKFAIPVAIPYFPHYAASTTQQHAPAKSVKKAFAGIKTQQ